MTALDKARARLEAAALVCGDKFATESDVTWNECVEFEAAALEFRNAYRAAEAATKETK